MQPFSIHYRPRPFPRLEGRRFILWWEREELGLTLFVGDWRQGRPVGACLCLRGRYPDTGHKVGFGRVPAGGGDGGEEA